MNMLMISLEMLYNIMIWKQWNFCLRVVNCENFVEWNNLKNDLNLFGA